MTANASSSSATVPSDCPDDLPPLVVEDAPMSAPDPTAAASRRALDLVAGERLPALPRAFLDGREHDLLAPLHFLAPGELPTTPAPAVDRVALAAALERANASYGHPRADELAARLAHPSTRVVVTGQQPGLFGGPLMGLTKTIAALRQARAFEARGERAVVVFWVATEDHDWAEVAQTTLLGTDGSEALSLGDDLAPLLPVGMRTFGDGLDELADRAADLLAGGRAGDRLTAARRWYRPDTRFGEAFSRFMIDLLGEQAPLYLDSMLPEVKRLQAPWMRRLVEERAALDDALARQHEAVEARGHALQVQPQPGVSPLFLLHAEDDEAAPARRRIEWRGDDRFGLRGLDGFERPVAELLEILDDNPSAVSPGVLARPAIQDALLGTSLQVLGPAELSYMAQASAVHRQLGLDGTWSSLRPQTVVLDARSAGYLDELEVTLGDLLTTPHDELIARRLGADPVAVARSEIDRMMCRLRQPVLDVDGSLESPWRKTRDSIRRSLDTLSKKTTAAIARRHEVWLRRLEQLQHLVVPGGSLQERRLSTLVFDARHGDALVAALLDQLDLDPRRLRAVILDD
ncbi:MAG: bacillithiol biosynthesis BshC [Acidobacteriota bacterium]